MVLWTRRYPTTEDMLEAYKASPVKYIKARLVPQVKPSNRLPNNANLWVCSSNWFRWCCAMLWTTALVTATNAHGIIMERSSFSEIWALCGLVLVYFSVLLAWVMLSTADGFPPVLVCLSLVHMLQRQHQLVVLCFKFANRRLAQESCRIDPPVTSCTRVDPDERVIWLS